MTNSFYKLGEAIVVDIDGCITDNSLMIPFPTGNARKDRDKFYRQVKYYDMWKCDKIKPLMPVINLVYALRMNENITPIFITAREDTCNGKIRKNTLDFLREHIGFGIQNSQLLMREENDLRPNYEVKQDLYNKYVKDRFNVLFALDDEENNVEMFRKNGVLALHVKDVIKDI